MEALLAFAIVSGQAIGPMCQQGLIGTGRQHQQVLVRSARHLIRLNHLYASSRVAGGLAKSAEQCEVGIQISNPGIIRQHHGGLRQVSQTGKREAGILEHAQVGHGDKVVVAAQIKGRLGINRTAHIVNDDVVTLALLDVIEHIAQLQAGLQGHRVQGQQHIGFAVKAVV